MVRGFVFLMAVLDWYPRKVLLWHVSISIVVLSCDQALEGAIAVYGAVKIMKTDQGFPLIHTNENRHIPT
jgi:hypothetical protein